MPFAIIVLSGALLSDAGAIAEELSESSNYDTDKLIGFGVILMLIGVAGTITFEILDRTNK